MTCANPLLKLRYDALVLMPYSCLPLYCYFVDVLLWYFHYSTDIDVLPLPLIGGDDETTHDDDTGRGDLFDVRCC